MQYEWINNVADISDDYIIIDFHDIFNQKIEPNTLPKNLTTLTFGFYFNQKIEPNTLSEKLTILIFGNCFNQKIDSNTLPNNITTLIFGCMFNQKIGPNTLPEKLTTLTFGCDFNQKIKPIMLLYSLKYIKFNWRNLYKNGPIEHYVEMVNNISSYYHVEIFLERNIFDIDRPKWPIHVVDYMENEWPLDIYKIQNKYRHPIHGSITKLINKEIYQPYSSAKSAIK